MGLRLNGSTSGYVELNAPAIAGTTNLTLPLFGFGKVLQIVTASDSSERSTTSTSYVDCGTLSVNITPSSTSSIILVMTSIPARCEATGQPQGFFRLANGAGTALNGAVEIPFGVASGFTTSGTARFDSCISMIGRDAPASTAAQTYKVQFAAASGTLTLARMSGRTSSIHAIEVGP